MGTLCALILIGALAASFCCVRAIAFLATSRIASRRSRSLSPDQRVSARLKDASRHFGIISRGIEELERRRRAERLEQEMPEALRLLSIALESGSSLVMALRYAAENCDEPLATELKRTVWDLEAGQGFDEALEKLRGRTQGSEFAFLSIAMEIQHQAGGSLTNILESVSSMLQQSAELKDELRTKTSQGRLSSRIVTIMPFALLGILLLFSPDYIAGFLSSPIGICLFALALLLEAVGVLFVKRALSIDFAVDLEEGV